MNRVTAALSGGQSGAPGADQPRAHDAGGPAMGTTSASPSRPRLAHALVPTVTGILAPIGLFYGIRAAGGSVWLALAAGAVVPAITALAGLLRRRRPDVPSLVMLAALAGTTALSLITGSPRALLAREGLVTAGWAAFMYASLL